MSKTEQSKDKVIPPLDVIVLYAGEKCAKPGIVSGLNNYGTERV
jgi:hypothetical protein